MRCWSCGTEIPGGLRYWGVCPACRQVEETKKIRERLESSETQSLYGAIELVGEGLTEGLSEVASILEWGFEEIEWKFDQIRGILGSIDETLKTPSTTQANEWRQIAEELRRKESLDESEKFFLKSLETNPLDYRTYIGLGKTYLQMNALDKARTFWQKSLPHAPKKEIDYKSYSYRLIGRTYFCEENYQQAASELRNAIELSPNYYLGHYDYAQYCALIGDKENCLNSLETALFGEPSLHKLAEKERNFNLMRNKVRELLTRLFSEASLTANEVLSELETALRRIEPEYGSEDTYILGVDGIHYRIRGLRLAETYKLGKFGLGYGKKKMTPGDYAALIEVKSIAEDCIKCLKPYLKYYDDLISWDKRFRVKNLASHWQGDEDKSVLRLREVYQREMR